MSRSCLKDFTQRVLEEALTVTHSAWFTDNVTAYVSPYPGLPHASVTALESSWLFYSLSSCVLEALRGQILRSQKPTFMQLPEIPKFS